jgi:hypothetical protein
MSSSTPDACTLRKSQSAYEFPFRIFFDIYFTQMHTIMCINNIKAWQTFLIVWKLLSIVQMLLSIIRKHLLIIRKHLSIIQKHLSILRKLLFGRSKAPFDHTKLLLIIRKLLLIIWKLLLITTYVLLSVRMSTDAHYSAKGTAQAILVTSPGERGHGCQMAYFQT